MRREGDVPFYWSSDGAPLPSDPNFPDLLWLYLRSEVQTRADVDRNLSDVKDVRQGKYSSREGGGNLCYITVALSGVVIENLFDDTQPSLTVPLEDFERILAEWAEFRWRGGR